MCADVKARSEDNAVGGVWARRARASRMAGITRAGRMAAGIHQGCAPHTVLVRGGEAEQGGLRARGTAASQAGREVRAGHRSCAHLRVIA